MGTIKEKLDYLNNTKLSIKDAIVAKGVEVTEADTFRSYADKITNIPAGGANPFNVIGYTEWPSSIDNDIAYSKNIQDNWDPTVTSTANMFAEDTHDPDKINVKYFPIVDTSNVVNAFTMFKRNRNIEVVRNFDISGMIKNTSLQSGGLAYMFLGCENLLEFTVINQPTHEEVDNAISSGYQPWSFEYAFSQCFKLKTMNLDFYPAGRLGRAFNSGCVIDIPDLNIPYCNNIDDMFNNYGGKHIGNINAPLVSSINYGPYNGLFKDSQKLISVGDLYIPKGNRFDHCFDGCKKLETVGELTLTNAENTDYMFLNCNELVNLPQIIDLPNAISCNRMFNGCWKLTQIPQLNLPKTTNIEGLFEYCKSLTSLNTINAPLVTNTGRLFSGCEKLTVDALNSLTIDFSKVTNMEGMFEGCKSMTTMPNIDMSSATCIRNMYSGMGLVEIGDYTSPVGITEVDGLFSRNESLLKTGKIDITNAERVDVFFESCTQLRRIEEFKNPKSPYMWGLFERCENLKYLNYVGLGDQQNQTDFDFGRIDWGNEVDAEHPELVVGALKSLTDSLIVNSYDRKAAGWGDFRISLSKKTGDRLTEDQKSQIQAKGYTLNIRPE